MFWRSRLVGGNEHLGLQRGARSLFALITLGFLHLHRLVSFLLRLYFLVLLEIVEEFTLVDLRHLLHLSHMISSPLFLMTMLGLLLLSIFLFILTFPLILCFFLLFLHGFLPELFDVGYHFRVGKLYSFPDFVNIIEERLELRKHVEELTNCDDSELLSLALSSESLVSKLQSYFLQRAIYQFVLNDGSKQLRNLLQIGGRVPVEESIFVE